MIDPSTYQAVVSTYDHRHQGDDENRADEVKRIDPDGLKIEIGECYAPMHRHWICLVRTFYAVLGLYQV